jgi:carboxypeptidase Q
MMINIRRTGMATFLVFSLMLSPAVAQHDTSQPQSAQIAGSILVGGHSIDYARELSDGFGGRVSGSLAYQRAAEWAATQFRAMGIKDVRLEPFTVPNGWERISAQARMIAPLDRPLQVRSYGWAPSTLPEGVTGEVVYVRHLLSQERVRAQAAKIKGNIVLINGESFSGDEQFLNSKYMASERLLKDLGASAILATGSTENNVTSSWDDTWGGMLEPIPIAEIGMEDGKLIERLLRNGPVTIKLVCENRVSGPMQVNNVVAEIRGREKPDEWILIGAHLDSWDEGTGAQDNGTGCAMVLEAARAIAQLNTPPRRSIRFVLWGGEEQGLLGSMAYIHQHSTEMKQCMVALNTSLGAGHPVGWTIRGNDDLKNAISPLAKSLSGMGGGGVKVEVKFEELSDWGTFLLAGIPTLDLWVDMAPYWEIHHKPSDTFDKIDVHNLAAGAAIVTLTAYLIAEQPAPVSKHLDQTAVDKVLQDAGVYETVRDLRGLGVLR